MNGDYTIHRRHCDLRDLRRICPLYVHLDCPARPEAGYNTLQEQVLDTLNEYTGTEIKRIIEEKNKDEYRELSKCLARLEHFSVGVNTGIYDKKTVYELSHGYLDVAIWYKLQPVMEQKQKGKKEDYYANYRKLVNWMKEQKKDTP